VLGLEHDTDPLRLELLLNPIGNLGREALLNLKVAREELDDTGELGDADDPLAWQVGDSS
jgi:hypothetical protein